MTRIPRRRSYRVLIPHAHKEGGCPFCKDMVRIGSSGYRALRLSRDGRGNLKIVEEKEYRLPPDIIEPE